MVYRFIFLLLYLSSFSSSLYSLQGKPSFEEGRLASLKIKGTGSFETLRQNFHQLLKEGQLSAAARCFEKMHIYYEPQAYTALDQQADAYFFLGVAKYLKGEFVSAHNCLDQYLSSKNLSSLSYFYQAMQHRFAIAEAYRKGGLRRPLGQEFLPKLFNGFSEALGLYDDVIASLPQDELASKAMFSKALLLKQQRLYTEALDSYKALIKGFPNSSLALAAFEEIADTYLCMSSVNAESPYLLELSKLHLKRFQQSYPNDVQQSQLIEHKIQQIEENFASRLFSIAKLYERKARPKAAVLYYFNAHAHYPQSNSGKKSLNRLKELQPIIQEMGLPGA